MVTQLKPLPQVKPPPRRKARWSSAVVSQLVITLCTLVVLVAGMSASLWLIQLQAPQSIVTNGADRWAADQRTTAATIPFTAPASVPIPVDPTFTTYYQAHAGARLLGAPLTPGFPTAEGWLQVFTANALLKPWTHPLTTTARSQADQEITALIQDGLTDRHTGILQLPLLQTLLTVGSQALIRGAMPYTDLRTATHPDQMVLALTSASSPHGTFIPEGTRHGQPIGHVIPDAFWAFLHRPAVSPDGWQTDLGLPLTEAIPFGTVEFGVSHRLLIQAFWRGALILDRDRTDASGQSLIQPLDTGIAFLQTLTPPVPVLDTHQALWANSPLTILNAPATGKALLQVGAHFPFTVEGQPRWEAGALWYQVRWQVPGTTGAGWVSASGISFTAPAKPSTTWAPGSGLIFTLPETSSPWTSFAQLAPDLATYLASLGDTAGVVVYDLTRQHYYASNLDRRYFLGNAVKLPILVAFLAMTEQQGRRPSQEELNQLRAMMAAEDVRAEDDDAGQAIYNAIGRSLGLKDELAVLGITGLTPEYDDWLYSLTQPLVMVQLWTLLEEEKVLSAQDRTLVFSLLAASWPDHQVGVGDTRPAGATVTATNGWLIGTDDRWAMNTSGIVTLGSETYVIAIFSEHLNALSDGQNIAQQVCTRVAALLE